MAGPDFGMLAAMTAAGYTEAGIRNVAAALAAGLPAPPPGDANNHTGTYVNTAITAAPPAPNLPNIPSATASAKRAIQNMLNTIGLGSLTEQVWSEHLSGVADDDLIPSIRDTPQYKARFPGMAALNNRGEHIDEGTYVQYESELRQTAQAAGLPPGFYDQPDDFTNFIAGGVSVQEYKDRIQNGFLTVQQAPPEVRSQFARMFGAQGDSALAAYFLDPDKALPVLQNQLARAQFSGTGERLGFQPTDAQSLTAAQMGLTPDQMNSGFAQLDKTRGLYTQQFGDRDSVTQQTGINAQFGLEAGDQEQLDKRLAERLAQFGGNPAAPQTDNSGVSGFGSATS